MIWNNSALEGCSKLLLIKWWLSPYTNLISLTQIIILPCFFVDHCFQVLSFNSKWHDRNSLCKAKRHLLKIFRKVSFSNKCRIQSMLQQFNLRYIASYYDANLLSICCHLRIEEPETLEITGFFSPKASLSGRKRHLGYWVTKVVFIVLPQMICCPILFDTPFLYCPIRAIWCCIWCKWCKYLFVANNKTTSNVCRFIILIFEVRVKTFKFRPP